MNAVEFPRTPGHEREAQRSAVLRRFGTAARDLDIDFNGPRVALTSALIESCSEPQVERSELLPISVRVRALLRLAALEGTRVELVVPCGCGEMLELALPLDVIARDPERVVSEVEVRGCRVRVPTGTDQQRFAELAGGNARLAMLRLLAGSDVEPELAGAIEAALDDADPLVGFFVRAECPSCGRSLRHDLDLETLAHRRLATAQARLVETIHRLASAYHWTEHDVLALPPARRARYLALIARTRGAA